MARVLVVDDNHDACELLARILRRAGHDATCQTTAKAALDYLQTNTPDVVIVDVMMPVMTGLDLLKAVRADPKTSAVAVVVYTALSDAKTRADAIRFGASGYVVKGNGWTDLQAEIQKHIGPSPSETQLAPSQPTTDP